MRLILTYSVHEKNNRFSKNYLELFDFKVTIKDICKQYDDHTTNYFW